MKYIFPLLILLYLFSFPSWLIGQNNNSSNLIGKVSCYEKCWAFTHPFILKKTIQITKEALKVTDSIMDVGNLEGSLSGGNPDAFKHAYWMASLSQIISSRKVTKLGKAHEKGNYKTFRKAKKKGIIDPHNLLVIEMDSWNNEKGIKIGSENKDISAYQLQQIIIDSILTGTMRIIRKDSLTGKEILIPSGLQKEFF